MSFENRMNQLSALSVDVSTILKNAVRLPNEMGTLIKEDILDAGCDIAIAFKRLNDCHPNALTVL